MRGTLLSIFTIIGGLGGIAGIIYLYSTVFKPGNLRITVACEGGSVREDISRSGLRGIELHIPVMIHNTGARPISIHAMNWILNKPDSLPIKVLSTPKFTDAIDSFVLEPKKMLSSNFSMSVNLRGGRTTGKGRDTRDNADELAGFKDSHTDRICLQVGCDIIGKYVLLHKRKSHHLNRTFDITRQVKSNLFTEG